MIIILIPSKTKKKVGGGGEQIWLPWKRGKVG